MCLQAARLTLTHLGAGLGTPGTGRPAPACPPGVPRPITRACPSRDPEVSPCACRGPPGWSRAQPTRPGVPHSREKPGAPLPCPWPSLPGQVPGRDKTRQGSTQESLVTRGPAGQAQATGAGPEGDGEDRERAGLRGCEAARQRDPAEGTRRCRGQVPRNNRRLQHPPSVTPRPPAPLPAITLIMATPDEELSWQEEVSTASVATAARPCPAHCPPRAQTGLRPHFRGSCPRALGGGTLANFGFHKLPGGAWGSSRSPKLHHPLGSQSRLSVDTWKDRATFLGPPMTVRSQRGLISRERRHSCPQAAGSQEPGTVGELGGGPGMGPPGPVNALGPGTGQEPVQGGRWAVRSAVLPAPHSWRCRGGAGLGTGV